MAYPYIRPEDIISDPRIRRTTLKDENSHQYDSGSTDPMQTMEYNDDIDGDNVVRRTMEIKRPNFYTRVGEAGESLGNLATEYVRGYKDLILGRQGLKDYYGGIVDKTSDYMGAVGRAGRTLWLGPEENTLGTRITNKTPEEDKRLDAKTLQPREQREASDRLNSLGTKTTSSTPEEPVDSGNAPAGEASERPNSQKDSRLLELKDFSFDQIDKALSLKDDPGRDKLREYVQELYNKDPEFKKKIDEGRREQQQLQRMQNSSIRATLAIPEGIGNEPASFEESFYRNGGMPRLKEVALNNAIRADDISDSANVYAARVMALENDGNGDSEQANRYRALISEELKEFENSDKFREYQIKTLRDMERTYQENRGALDSRMKSGLEDRVDSRLGGGDSALQRAPGNPNIRTVYGRDSSNVDVQWDPSGSQRGGGGTIYYDPEITARETERRLAANAAHAEQLTGNTVFGRPGAEHQGILDSVKARSNEYRDDYIRPEEPQTLRSYRAQQQQAAMQAREEEHRARQEQESWDRGMQVRKQDFTEMQTAYENNLNNEEYRQGLIAAAKAGEQEFTREINRRTSDPVGLAGLFSDLERITGDTSLRGRSREILEKEANLRMLELHFDERSLPEGIKTPESLQKEIASHKHWLMQQRQAAQQLAVANMSEF
jgi:hypothetical protein